MSALLLRAWIEPGVPPRLRARMLELRPGRNPRPLAVTASIEEACQAVRRWLESLRGPISSPPGPPADGAPASGETSSENGDGTVTHQD